MCGGGDRRDVWRGGGAAAWRVLWRGSLKALWRGVLAGGEREKWEQNERGWPGEVGIWVFFSLNSNGRAGGYPPDKKLKTRGPPETRIRKIIKSVIRPCMTHGRAGGWAGQPDLSGGLESTGFCPPLIPLLNKQLYNRKWIRTCFLEVF